MFKPTALISLLLTLLLTACGGDSGGSVVGGGDGSGDGGTDVSKSTVTYFPLQIFMQGEGYVEGAVFGGIWFDRLIHGYMIAPVDSKKLLPVENPDVSEFNITINEEPIDAPEQGLIMQPVVGLPVTMDTAILVDTSSSTQSVDKAALIAEVKAYIQQAQSSSDPAIRNQRFTIWAFGTRVDALVGTLTSDATTLNNALTSLQSSWDSRGVATALYEAIVRSIGTYVGNGSAESDTEINLLTDGNDELFDGYRYDAAYGSGRSVITGLNVSSVVLFSTGGNSRNLFGADAAQAALSWQSFLVYDEEAAAEDTTDGDTTEDNAGSAAPEGMALLSKPLIYVAIGGVDSVVNGMAAATISTGVADFSNVSEQVIEAQQTAIALRTRPENQYLVRYAVLDRDGKYNIVFASNTDGFNYGLTTELEFNPASFESEVAPVVEITGPSNAYLVNNTVSVANATKLYPATRWTTIPFTAANYSWTVGGSARAAAADGSITISAADAGQNVVLTNNSLSSGTTTATVAVTN